MTDTNPKIIPINLDREAGDHDMRMVNLRELVVHIADYAINELPDSPAARTLMALTDVAKDVAIAAEKEADALNVNGSTLTHLLMAVPKEKFDYRADGKRVRAAFATAADPDATREEITRALAEVCVISDDNDDYTTDLQAMIRIASLRGYAVGWLNTASGDTRPHLTPSLGMVNPPVQSNDIDDIRASLTAEEIETTAHVFSVSLHAYLMSVLSHSQRMARELKRRKPRQHRTCQR
jgi:hypothetical protein